MFKKMEAMLPHGWDQYGHHMRQWGGFGANGPTPVLLNNSFWQGQPGPLGARASIPAQDYAEDLMKRASDAVRAHVGGDGGARAANAAADDLLRRRPLHQASGLLYLSNGTLFDHVDGHSHYLCLMSMGCAVDFTAGDRVVRFQSGDCIIFNGGAAHGACHITVIATSRLCVCSQVHARSRHARRSQGARSHRASLAAQASQRAPLAAAAPAMIWLQAAALPRGPAPISD